MRAITVFVSLLIPCLLLPCAFAQEPDADTSTTLCTFADGNQMSLQYRVAEEHGNEPHEGKLWTPGGSPLTLFTQCPIELANTAIPVGAYSVYFIPGKKSWTLIVNRNVTAGASYDETQDLVRAPMEVVPIDVPGKLQISFAHMAPKQCSLRLYSGKAGAFAEFMQK